MSDTPIVAGMAENRWNKLDSTRYSILRRARQCAAVTIPHLLPPEGFKETDSLPTPYQGLGSRAVNNLTSKLQLTLFPPNTSFGKLGIEAGMKKVLQTESGEGAVTKVEKELAAVERDIVDFNEQSAFRTHWSHALRLMMVTGNALLVHPEVVDETRVFRLDNYVVRRSPSGKVLEIVVREYITPSEVPAEVTDAVKSDPHAKFNADEKNVPLYTYVCWNPETELYEGFQEVYGHPIPDTDFSYPPDKPEYIPLVWHRNSGENYGRGHVEEYLGDFLSLEGLAQALLEGAAAMALLIFLVNPTGMTKLEDIKKTRNGSYCAGVKDDISVLQAEKYADFKVAAEEAAKIEMRIARAFLLRESVQRDAERVTAEEIRIMAQELEDSLGGIYSTLALTMQLPIFKRVIAVMQKGNKLGPFPKEVKITISTGFEALGRGHDIAKLKNALSDILPLGEDIIRSEFNVQEYIERIFTGHGVSLDNLLLTAEQKAQNQATNQANEFTQNAASAIVNKVGDQMVPPQQ